MTTARTHNDISDGREHMHTARRHGDGPASRGVFYPTSPHEPASHTPATPLPACSPTSPPRAPDSRGAASAREERGLVCFLVCGLIDLSYTVVPPPPALWVCPCLHDMYDHTRHGSVGASPELCPELCPESLFESNPF